MFAPGNKDLGMVIRLPQLFVINMRAITIQYYDSSTETCIRGGANLKTLQICRLHSAHLVREISKSETTLEYFAMP